jgi:hypothetical protein
MGMVYDYACIFMGTSIMNIDTRSKTLFPPAYHMNCKISCQTLTFGVERVDRNTVVVVGGEIKVGHGTFGAATYIVINLPEICAFVTECRYIAMNSFTALVLVHLSLFYSLSQGQCNFEAAPQVTPLPAPHPPNLLFETATTLTDATATTDYSMVESVTVSGCNVGGFTLTQWRTAVVDGTSYTAPSVTYPFTEATAVITVTYTFDFIAATLSPGEVITFVPLIQYFPWLRSG